MECGTFCRHLNKCLAHTDVGVENLKHREVFCFQNTFKCLAHTDVGVENLKHREVFCFQNTFKCMANTAFA